MQRSQRLQVVLDLEKRREDAALTNMQQARNALQAEEQRLEELQQYLAEYHEQMRKGSQGTVHVARLQAMHGFVNQLNDAIGHQRQRVESFQQQFAQARDQWRQAWDRREGMARFIEECRRQEQHAADRQEQREIDEAANLRFAHKQRH
ncbi:flagellar export protein FliJ [Marinobacteraceae bacterium S3BR75-40.1]